MPGNHRGRPACLACWRCLMNTRTLLQEGFLLLGGSCPTFSSRGGHSPTGFCQPKNCKSPAGRFRRNAQLARWSRLRLA
jgi:hypothetical protein